MIFKSDEPERLNLDETGKKSLWMPPALASIISPRMKTRGRYKNGWPVGAIVHFTSGRPNAEATISYGRKQGYCYLCIGPDGHVLQAHPMNEWGYHAGKSSYPGLGSGVSQYLVGIEITCAGMVEKVAPNRYKSWFGSIYRDEEVRFSPKHDNIQKGYYHKYTKEQEEALIRVIKWLYFQAPDVFKIDFVLGHDEVAPDRKNDPGGSLSMTMPEFRSFLKKELFPEPRA